MEPMQVLELVRQGYALASPDLVGVVGQCLDLDVIDGRWVPRWALEAQASLVAAGYSLSRIRDLFCAGRARVYEELASLVRQGKRARVLEPRRPHERQRIDLPTEAALVGALELHRARCERCRAGRPCLEAEELQEELELLFPPERRHRPRT